MGLSLSTTSLVIILVNGRSYRQPPMPPRDRSSLAVAGKSWLRRRQAPRSHCTAGNWWRSHYRKQKNTYSSFFCWREQTDRGSIHQPLFSLFHLLFWLFIYSLYAIWNKLVYTTDNSRVGAEDIEGLYWGPDEGHGALGGGWGTLGQRRGFCRNWKKNFFNP